jgi:hypothetical protein
MDSFLRCQFIPIRPITDIDDLNEPHRQDGLRKLLLRPLRGSDQIGFDVACRVASLLVHYITGGESLASWLLIYARCSVSGGRPRRRYVGGRRLLRIRKIGDRSSQGQNLWHDRTEPLPRPRFQERGPLPIQELRVPRTLQASRGESNGSGRTAAGDTLPPRPMRVRRTKLQKDGSSVQNSMSTSCRHAWPSR